jgi:NADH-quinone oxidoreductase subunit A
MTLTSEFILVGLLAAFAVTAVVPTIIIPVLFAPKRPNPIKSQPFESGQVPKGESRVHLMMQYYAYLIMFVVFDVVIMFMLAWSTAFARLGPTSALVVLPFLVAIFIPMWYALKMAGKREAW